MANLKPLSTRPHVNYGQENSYKLQQERQEGNCEMQLAAGVTLTNDKLNTAFHEIMVVLNILLLL